MSSAEREYHIIIDPSVNERMAEHMEFLARVSEEAASRLLEEMMDAIRSLKKMPFRNPYYNRAYLPVDKYRQMIFCNKRYRIVYQVSSDFVFIDDIQDCRQNEDKSILLG